MQCGFPSPQGLEPTFEAFESSADPGLTMLACSAEPATPSDDGIKLLASWAVTQRRAPVIEAEAGSADEAIARSARVDGLVPTVKQVPEPTNVDQHVV